MFLYCLAVNAVVTSLSCSEACEAHPVQYHCETSTMNLIWEQEGLTLGGFSFNFTTLSKDGYSVTIVPNNNGGLSSNITFIAHSNNGSPIHCIDYTVGFDMAYNCSIIIGEF